MWLLLLGWEGAGTVGLGSAECVLFAGKPWLCRMTSAVADLGAMAGFTASAAELWLSGGTSASSA